MAPFPLLVADGSRVGEFRADRHQVALQFPINRAGGFDGDDLAHLVKAVGEFDNGVEEHGFSTGEDDMIDVLRRDLGNDFVESLGWSFGFPGGVWGVAPDAAEVASADTDESGGDSGPDSFALDGVKYFGNAEFQS